jgi:hypothetical protein
MLAKLERQASFGIDVERKHAGIVRACTTSAGLKP